MAGREKRSAISLVGRRNHWTDRAPPPSSPQYSLLEFPLDAATKPRDPKNAYSAPTVEQLASQVARLGSRDAAKLLARHDQTIIHDVLQAVSPGVAGDIIAEMDADDRHRLYEAAPAHVTRQWSLNQTYPADSIGFLMEPPYGVFKPTDTIHDVIISIKSLVKTQLVTYCFVVDPAGRLMGVVTMRDLLVSEESATLDSVMLRNPFTLLPELELKDAMKKVLNRHFPVYPVCDSDGKLIGLVRGQTMFEEQAFEISAQPGQMVGVDKEERLITPWKRSLKFRHPWLQLNLLTAFVAAAVVGFFQDTLDQIVILAVFLPVLAGQSGNTGCQALAVTLRGITLGELKSGTEKALVAKEALLGLLNGGLVGITAGIGMFIVASMQNNPNALALGFIVSLAMIGSCVVSGLSGALIPIALRKVGADPATASSIFLTTMTDVASMGIFLSLATLLLM
jgi:magnesium transporter